METNRIIRNVISISTFFAGVLLVYCIVCIFNTVFLSKDFFIVVLIILLCLCDFYINELLSEKEISSEHIGKLKEAVDAGFRRAYRHIIN